MRPIIVSFIQLLVTLSCYSNTITYQKNEHGIVNLDPYITYYIDSTAEEKFTVIKYKTFKKIATPNFGHTKNAVWLKFKVLNNSREKLFFQINPEWTPHIEVYKLDPPKNFNYRKRGGTLHPYKLRTVHSNKHIFPTALKDQEAGIFFVKLSGNHIIAPHITLSNRSTLQEYNRIENQLYFIFIGVVIILFFYNSLLTLINKEKSYFFYSLYIICMATGILFTKGYPNEWADFFYLSDHYTIFFAGMVIFIMLSIGHFVDVKHKFKWLYRSQICIIVLATIAIMTNLLGHIRLANELTSTAMFLNAIWGLTIGSQLIKAEATSKLIFIGYTSFIIGGMIHILRLRGYVDHNWITSNAFLIGSALELTCISISFGMRIFALNNEKITAQKEHINQIQRNEELITQQKNELEIKVKQRTSELAEINEELLTTLNTINDQHLQLESRNKKIQDSISYSKRIQDALLPDRELVLNAGLDLGIYYQPKDVLSGDFYWFGERKNKLFIAVADCTGHGVPGAMMSVSGHSLLNRIIFEERYNEVDLILGRLHIELTELLHTEKTDTQDGMDIQILCINKNDGTISYSGARNPIYFTDTSNQLHKLKADKHSIGGTPTYGLPEFTKHQLPQDWQNIFLFTDGYQDQFGTSGKKFMVGKFKKLLADISHLKTNDQIKLLKETLQSWQAEEAQTDDILVATIQRTPLFEKLTQKDEKKLLSLL